MYDKYLVTGATGFLGRAVVEALARRGARVHALMLYNEDVYKRQPLGGAGQIRITSLRLFHS